MPRDTLERWQSGRMRRTRNPVYGYTVPWVRIPPFPPGNQALRPAARLAFLSSGAGVERHVRQPYGRSGLAPVPVVPAVPGDAQHLLPRDVHLPLVVYLRQHHLLGRVVVAHLVLLPPPAARSFEARQALLRGGRRVRFVRQHQLDTVHRLRRKPACVVAARRCAALIDLQARVDQNACETLNFHKAMRRLLASGRTGTRN